MMCVCVCVSKGVCSGSAALDESWVQADVSDVMSVQQPGEETLQTQTVTTVRTCAILPLVSVPVVRSRVDPLPLVSLQQLLGVPDTH